MKKLLKSFALLSLAALSFVSCNKEIEDIDAPQDKIYYITCDVAPLSTKTTAVIGEESVDYSWTEEDYTVADRWHVYCATKTVASVAPSKGDENALRLTIGFTEVPTDGDKFYAYYNGGVSGTQTINSSKSPYHEASDVLRSEVVNCNGNNTSYTLRFKRESAFGQATLKGLTNVAKITSITITATDSTPLAANWDAANGAFSAEGSSTITIDYSSSPLMPVDGNFTTMFATLPVDPDGEDAGAMLKITVNGKDSEDNDCKYVKTFTRRIKFVKGDVLVFGVSGFSKVDTKVSFVVNGNAVNVITEEGDSIPFPAEDPSVEGYSFMGWAPAEIVGTQASAPANLITKAQAASAIAHFEGENKTLTYYAVFAKNKTTLDFTDDGWGFPAGSGNKKVDETSYTNNGNTISVAGSNGNGFYLIQSQATPPANWALLFGKNGAYLKLPTTNNVTKLIVYPALGGSPSQKVIWDVVCINNDETISATTDIEAYTGLKSEEKEIEIAEQFSDKQLIIIVKDVENNSNNLQISKIDICFKAFDYCTTVGGADTRTPVNMSTFTTAGSVTTIIKGNTLGTSVTNDQSGWTSAYSYSSDNDNVATIAADGTITAVAKGTAKITASLNVSNSDASYKAGTTISKSIDITVTNPSHHYTFSANGTTFSEGDVEEGVDIPFPKSEPEDVGGKTFVGWYDDDYSNASTAPTYVSSATMGESDVIYKAVYAIVAGSTTPTTVTWNVNGVNTSATGGNTVNTTLSTSSVSPSTETGVWTAYATNSYAATSSQKAQLGSGSYKFAGTITLSGSAIPANAQITQIDLTATSTATDANPYSISVTVGGKAFGSAQNISSGNANCQWIGSGTGNTIVLTTSCGYNKNIVISALAVQYKNKATCSNYTTLVKVLQSITVSGTPTKTSYDAGDALDPTGLTVTGTYLDGTKSEITDGIDWTLDPETLSAGATTCDVMATVGQIVSDVFTVTGLTVNSVTAATLSSVTLSGDPTKTIYVAGEHFNPAGITVTANYSDGSSDDVTSSSTFYGVEDNLTAGQTSFETYATYQGVESDVATYTISVQSEQTVFSVTLNTNGGTINEGNVTEYTKGDGATLPTNVTKSNYLFMGWYDNSDLTGDAVSSIDANDTGNKTFWAKWNSSSVSFTFGYAQWDDVTDTFSGSSKDVVTQTKSDVQCTYTRNGSSLYANTSALRLYKLNTLEFKAPSGYVISAIVFTCNSYQTDITSDVGTCSALSNKLSWSGSASSVTFTRPSSASSYATITGATITLQKQ